jgi:hypothetical protein
MQTRWLYALISSRVIVINSSGTVYKCNTDKVSVALFQKKREDKRTHIIRTTGEIEVNTTRVHMEGIHFTAKCNNSCSSVSQPE